MKCLATWLLLSMLLLVGCSETPDAKTLTASAPPTALAPEAQKAARQRGKAIVAETFKLLSSKLQTAIQQGGGSNALPFCSLAASPLTAGLAGKQGVTIRRVTQKAPHPASRADATELAILKESEAALTGTNAAPLVANLTENTATFFAPLILNNELCQRYHGEPGEDITAEDIAVIQRSYPQDEAIGFKLGQLHGAWRIDIPLAGLPRAQ